MTQRQGVQQLENMDKRTWPWKKKLGDKTSTSAEAEQISPSRSFSLDDQVISGLMIDHVQVSNAALPQDQADEKIKHLNERLIAADHLVKQHVKVAEEAVSGWEKSKAEYVSLKHQLEAVMEQKQASEDRVSQLDGGLKESMWQLRQIREEQEQRIHDAIVKKTREWENSRLELQQRLADADHQLVEAGFQNSLLLNRIQEQAEVIAELGQARSQAEAQAEMLQVRVETFEKENASLKYELMILNKELAIRNQEREINKKSLDVVSRQKAESVRKINKLEVECQRLRVLVRKKLPGPGALAQMKLEVEGLDAERGDFHNKWRSGGKKVSSPKAAESMLNSDDTLLERLLTMEEETKLLKEALAKRNSELQAARLMYAKTADKLSTLEHQVGQVQNSPRRPLLGYGFRGAEACVGLEPSHASMSEDGNEDVRSVADSWASALITELACFQKEKGSPQQPRKAQYSPKASDQLDSIDDFIAVERLVSLPLEQMGMEFNRAEGVSAATISKETLAAKEAELQAANTLCAELNNKLVLAEEQLSLLNSKNAANELNLFSLQQKLNMILETLNGGDAGKASEDLKSALSASQRSSVDGLQAHVMKLSKASSPSAGSDTPPSLERSPYQKSSSHTCDDKISNIRPELTSAIREVVSLVEELFSGSKAKQSEVNCSEEQSNNIDSGCGHTNNHAPLTQRSLELDTTITNLSSTTNQFFQGKVELVQLMRALSSVLSHFRNVGLSTTHLSLISRERQKQEATKAAEQEVFSDAGGPFSTMSTYDGSEHLSAKVLPSGDRLSNLREPRTDEELRKIRTEKAALESHMRAELSRMDKLEEMLAQLQQEKSELANMLEEEKEKLESFKGQLLDAENLVANLRVRLAAAESSRTMAEERRSSTAAENAKLVLQLQESQAELTKMHEMLNSLEITMNEEHARNEELQIKVELLQERLQRPSSDPSQAGAGHSADKITKQEEMVDAAEKLAECQRTILVLGKQIQNIASARGSLSISFNSSVYDSQDEGLHKEDITKHANGNSTSQKSKQRGHSDPGDSNILDVTDEELISAAKGERKGSSDDKPPTHEDYIQVVSQMPSSPDAETNTKLVPYVPKAALRKKGSRPSVGANDLDTSSPKRGNSFSRFFSRNKKVSV
eukprot:c22980_g1_i1 orf=322-3747(+)